MRLKHCRNLSQHFFQQAEEEKGHALRFIKYMVDAGGRVVIPAIDAPKSKFKTPRDAVKLSLDQEIHVTQQINGLVELARKQNDYITINFLQWFLTEQLEEVSSMDNLLKIVDRAGNDLVASGRIPCARWYPDNAGAAERVGIDALNSVIVDSVRLRFSN